MAKKISELPAASALTGAESIELVQSASSKRATLADLPVSLATQTALAGKLSTSGGTLSAGLTIGPAPSYQGVTWVPGGVSRLLNVVPPDVSGSNCEISAWGVGAAGALVMQRANTSLAAPTPVLSGERIGVFLASAYATGGLSNVCAIEFYSREAYDVVGGGRGSEIRMQTVALGAAGRSTVMRVANEQVSPNVDNSQSLGTAALRYSQVYAANATINTSDAREKTAVRAIDNAERNAARDLLAEIGIYQFLDAVESKGADSARLHTGLTVQRAIEVMASHGLDAMRYGFICHDQWAESVEEVDDDAGDLVRIVQRQAMRETVTTEQSIEVIDGTPTLVSRVSTEREPLFESKAVVTADGKAVVGDDGNPVMYPVPVMEDAEQRYRRVVTPAGDRYSFRETRLIMFILAAMQ